MARNASQIVSEYRIRNRMSRYSTLSFFSRLRSIYSLRFGLFKKGKLTNPNCCSFHIINESTLPIRYRMEPNRNGKTQSHFRNGSRAGAPLSHHTVITPETKRRNPATPFSHEMIQPNLYGLHSQHLLRYI